MKRFVAAVIVVGGAVACGGDVVRTEWVNTFEAVGDDAFLVDDDFVCLADSRYEQIGKTRIWNALGRQQQAVEHARSGGIGAYPVGTVIQLFPGEASVKRARGFSPATGDWEFFVLNVDSGESVITERGTTEIANIGGTCLSCHGRANAFDYACFTNTGCGPLPFFINTDMQPDRDDPRCR